MFEHDVHPHTAIMLNGGAPGPVKTGDMHDTRNRLEQFNARLAVRITRVVGSMWCAYAFGLFDLISLPEAVHGGIATTIAWIAQTFLQLVLLSIIMVGQDVQARASDARSEQTYRDAEAILHECLQLQAHLQAQDETLTNLILAHSHEK